MDNQIIISNRSLYVLLKQYYCHSHMEKQTQQHLVLMVAISLAGKIIDSNNYTVILENG